jgi:hypothetical protein
VIFVDLQDVHQVRYEMQIEQEMRMLGARFTLSAADSFAELTFICYIFVLLNGPA